MKSSQMKKIFLIIITFLSISTAFCQTAETQQPNIEIQEIDVTCGGRFLWKLPEKFIIRDKKEYDKYFCYCSSCPEIDFDKYTLIGFYKENINGCRMPCYKYNYYKQNNNYFLYIEICQNGPCRVSPKTLCFSKRLDCQKTKIYFVDRGFLGINVF